MATYDKSLANKTNFLLTFDKAPGVQYFCQGLTIPAVSLDGVELDTGRHNYLDVGGNLQFEELVISFLVDENLTNYKEIYDWFMLLRSPLAGNPGSHITTSTEKSDATITVLDNNKNPQVRFGFVDCWPTSLSGLTYDVMVAGDEPQVGEITLSYSYYTMETV